MNRYSRIRAAIHVLRGRPLVFGCHLLEWPRFHPSVEYLMQDCFIDTDYEPIPQRLASAQRMTPEAESSAQR